MRGCGSGRDPRVSGINALYLTQSSTQGANVIHKLLDVCASVLCLVIMAWLVVLGIACLVLEDAEVAEMVSKWL